MKTFICKQCEKEFESKKPSRKYCSRKCQFEGQKKIKSAICKNCGKEFHWQGSETRPRIYCSRECSGADNTPEYKRRYEITGICHRCGMSFTYLSGKTRKYCGPNCTKLYRKERVAKEIKKPVICPICKIPFISKTKTQKYCSHKCASEAKKRPKYSVCKCCGKEFEWLGSITKPREFCSRECNAAFNTKPSVYKKCKRCGKDFIYNKNDKTKYCSAKCYYLYKNENPKQYKMKETTRKKLSRTALRKINSGELIIKNGITVSQYEEPLLNELEAEFGIEIKRQYRVGRWLVDGYIPEWNLAIEIDEKHHRYPSQQKRDRMREEAIFEKIGCNFMRIRTGW